MSNNEKKTPIPKATNVARNINITVSPNEEDTPIEITSTASASGASRNTNQDEYLEPTIATAINTNGVGSKESEGKENKEGLSAASNEKKTSTKNKSIRKYGPNAETLNRIKDAQEARQQAELKADEEFQEQQRLKKEREQKRQEELRSDQERREKRSQKKKQRMQKQKEDGSYLTKGQREKRERTRIQLEAAGIHIPERNIPTSNNEESVKKRIVYDDNRKKIESNEKLTISVEIEDKEMIEEEEEENKSRISSTTENDQQNSESESKDNDQTLSSLERVRHRLERYHEICENHRSSEVFRAPVICVLGHVDAGKTTILDNLRRTHVQKDEAGGITQQIGATNVPLETIYERTKMCRQLVSREGDYIVPGLLIIDTPGHESFKNLRSRGSSLCDLAILVVDLMHGLKQQTIESIRLLKERQTPFIIALNKIDLLYGWKSDHKKNIELVLQKQDPIAQNQFEKLCNNIIAQFAIQDLNVALYYKNPDPNEFYSMVPTSARSGDGMGSLISLIIEKCQTTLAKRISYTDELQATVMEVKVIAGLGTTIDVALVNGCLSVGDKIIVAGQEGPIVSQIRGLLIPAVNQELRVTNQYENHEKVKAACGIKILAKDLEKSMAGLPLFVIRKDDEIEYFKTEIQFILRTALNSIQLKEKGVYVQTSTLGSLEALLELLKTSDIPCAGVNIGPVHRKDVIRASTQFEKGIEWATILAFDVKIEKDAQVHAESIGVKILQNDEVYHLRDMFIAHQANLKRENQEKYRHLAVFPCKLKILPQCIFNSRDPIVCGVLVEDGFIKLGTPICVPSKEFVDLGRIVSIEMNHKSLDSARKGSEVCIKIQSIYGETPKLYGRHFDKNDILMSKITRESIDIVKAHFREDMQKSDWELIIQMKTIFHIV